LEIRFILGVGRLRERRDRYEPLVAPIGNVRTDENVSDFRVVVPIGKNEFVQEFESDRKSG